MPKIIWRPFVGDYAQDGSDIYAQGAIPVGIGTIYPASMPGQVSPLTAARSPVLQQLAMMDVGGSEVEQVNLSLVAGAAATRVYVSGVPQLTSCRISFEPYQAPGTPSPSNPIPITGWIGAEAKRADTAGGTPTSTAHVDFPVVSANQWDGVWEQGSYSTTDGEPTAGTDKIRSKNYTPVEPDTHYYHCFSLGGGSTQIRIHYYDANKSWISSYSGVNEFVTPSNCAYIRFNTGSSFGGTYPSPSMGYIAINYPSTVTNYNPYSRTIYGGFVDTETGYGEIEWKLIDLGDLNWNYYTSGNYPFFESSTISEADKTINVQTCLSTCFKGIENKAGQYWSVNNVPYEIGFNSIGGSPYVRVQCPDYTDKDTFKFAVTGEKLCFKLTTPIQFNVDPATLTLQSGNNWVWAEMEAEA